MNYRKYINELSLDNKYTKWYCSIIEKALVRSNNRKHAKELLGYVEGHHIIPKCFNIDNTDIAFLTAKEHFVVHHLLCKMIRDRKNQLLMAHAFFKMCYFVNTFNKERIIVSAKFYDIAKREFSKARTGYPVSEITKEKLRKIGSNYDKWVKKYGINIAIKKREMSYNAMSLAAVGKSKSKEHAKNISISKKGWIPAETTIKNMKIAAKKRQKQRELNGLNFIPKEQRLKMSISATGKSKSDEHRKNISIFMLNAQNIKCKYCDMISSAPLINRWHNEKCKFKELQ